MGFPTSAPFLYHISLLRRWRRIFQMNLFLHVYKSDVQPYLAYSITLYGCSTQKNIDMFQRGQNHTARLIMGNFDYINCRGIDLIKSLNLFIIRKRRDNVHTKFMFKAIHGIAPYYLSDRIEYAFWYSWLWHQGSGFNERLSSYCP